MSIDDWRSLDVLLPRKFSRGGATVVVAIVGASGSGKSELARLVARLLRRTGEDVVVVDSDRYWKTSLYGETMYESVRERMLQCEYNRDHPDHYDLELHAEDVRYIKQLAVRASEDVNGALSRCCSCGEGGGVEGCATAGPPAVPSIILVEGILLLDNDDLRGTADLKVFCDCDIELVVERRMARDPARFDWKYGGEPGRLAYYEKFTKPGFYRFILPRKAEADLVVPNNLVDGPLAENEAVSGLVEVIKMLNARAPVRKEKGAASNVPWH